MKQNQGRRWLHIDGEFIDISSEKGDEQSYKFPKYLSLMQEKITVARGMITYGGGFFKHLGEALLRADVGNTIKIKSSWFEDWEKYLEMGRQLGLDLELEI